ncbi:hypothetical protein VB773_17435 [Haloarculaceae archaeon H-GB2-1]|nr:hypothetical protein [Haloarculaceae archaeon H-GB1-1]MEA5387688.1 hypothetical protein [Haloarculaceae archaeon H-GB11]MEA5409177.1 hypothetical protein [Haloarculaceae archaeon H-GB2-1]
MTELTDLVQRALSEETAAEFDDRVREQAATLRDEISAGNLDNEAFTLGLEVEVYAVRGGSARADGGTTQALDGMRLARLPDAVFDSAVNKELGLHNAELNTDPTAFDEAGLAEQATDLTTQLSTARELAGEEYDVVLDAMWGVPGPEGSDAYLTDTVTEDGVVVAQNMRQAPRYVALDNEALRLAGGSLDFSVAGFEYAFPSIIFESLTSSIQPHLQIPATEEFPQYFAVAIRTMAPLLALASNSPFLPGDLYGDVADPETLVEETAHELRIAAFEQSMNQTPNRKVRVPDDIDSRTDVVDAVVEDDRFAPFLEEWVRDPDDDLDFGERFFEYGHARGTFWRWVRCVIGGDAVDGAADERSMRIEYRPLPTQPTIRDNVGLLALTAGLLRGLVEADHPLPSLDWDATRESFYDVVDNGLDAEFAWISADGERTSDPEVVFDEVFEYAREGLAAQGFDADARDRYLRPFEARWEARTAPSDWKKAQVRDNLADGESLEEAIVAMQESYVARSRETESFAEWL